ncbi:VOC family protein [bacterium]|nr:VOC family protein [bacterium]
MCEHDHEHNGAIIWQDLTVANAAGIKNFYADVIGWKPRTVEMGGYLDYEMLSPGSGEVEAGICHSKGENSNLPPQWLVYIKVENVEESAEKCKNLGGEVIDGPRKLGEGTFCVIKDPAGAVAALYQD